MSVADTGPDISTRTDVSETLAELKLKVRSLREDRDYFHTLHKSALAAFEKHRQELTLLRQKEHAIHTANEDKLRDQLRHTLQENRTLLDRIHLKQQEQEQCIKQRLCQARDESGHTTIALEEELRSLREAWRTAKADVLQAEQCCEREESTLREIAHAQASMHEELQRAKKAAAEELDAWETELARYPSGCTPRSCRQAVTDAHRFVPPGPTDPLSSTSPASHHAVSLLSTVERRNVLRPRTYLQRHHMDAHYTASPFRRKLQSLRQRRIDAEKDRCKDETRWGSPDYLPSLPPLMQPAESTPSRASHGTPTTQQEGAALCPYGEGPGAASRRIKEEGCLRAVLTSPSRKSTSGVEVGSHSGTATNAACKAILEELLQLKQDYAYYRDQLRQPRGDSVEASQQMRRIMADIDRKVTQVRALRSLQNKFSDQLRLNDILREIRCENNYCESVYADLMELIRFS